MDKATIHMMNINMNKEENKQYIYHQPEVIETDSFKKWEYWLYPETAPFNTKTRCGTVYRTPMTDRDRADIYQFKEQIQIIIASGNNDLSDRANRIIELAAKHQNDFKNFDSFSKYYFLFECSPENPILMEELSKIIMKLTGLVKDEGLFPSDYFWATESKDGLGKILKINIQGGR